MPYTINKTNGTKITIVQDGTTDITTLPITLLGKNFTGYGEPVNENFVKILENFANTTPPNKPMLGQLWYNTTDKVLKLNTGVGAYPWKSVGVIEHSNTKPVGYNAGDLWFKTDAGQLYAYSGSGTTWNLIGPLDTKAADNGAFSDTVLNFDTGLSESVVKFRVKGVETGIISSTKFSVKPVDQSYAEYPALKRGITFPNATTNGVSYIPVNDTGYMLWGTAASSLGIVKNDGTYIPADSLVTTAGVASLDTLWLHGDAGLQVGTQGNFRFFVTDSNTGNIAILSSPNPAKLNINLGSTSSTVMSLYQSTVTTDYILAPANGVSLFLGTSTNKLSYISAGVIDAGPIYDSGKRVITNITVPSGNGITGSVSYNGITATVVMTNTGVVTVTGTVNQVLVNGGIGSTSGSVTLSLPQDIGQASTVTFARVNSTQVYDSGNRVITTATLQNFLSGYVPTSAVGVPNGVPSTNNAGVVPTSQLPLSAVNTLGIVALNDTLSSTSTTQALTANQGKQLGDWLNVVLYTPIAWPLPVAPDGFTMMMGQTISQALYPILYSLYGSTLPDMRGEFIRGWDAGRGVDTGRTLGSWQADDFKSHKHTTYWAENPVSVTYPNGYESTNHRGNGSTNDFDNAWPYTSNTGGTETRPRNVAFNYIVKLG